MVDHTGSVTMVAYTTTRDRYDQLIPVLREKVRHSASKKVMYFTDLTTTLRKAQLVTIMSKVAPETGVVFVERETVELWLTMKERFSHLDELAIVESLEDMAVSPLNSIDIAVIDFGLMHNALGRDTLLGIARYLSYQVPEVIFTFTSKEEWKE